MGFQGEAGDAVQESGDVFVDPGDQFLDGDRVRVQRFHDLAFAVAAVGEGLVHGGHGVVDHVAVARRHQVDAVVAQQGQGVHIGRHGAGRRGDDHGGALNQVVAGEQQVLVHHQITQVIADMPGRGDHFQFGAAAIHPFAVTQAPFRGPGFVLQAVVGHVGAEQARAAGLGQFAGAGGVVAVGMGDQNLFDRAADLFRRVQQRLGVFVVHRARVDDRERAVTDQIGVGAGPGHHSRVAAEYPPGVGCDWGRVARNERCHYLSYSRCCASRSRHCDHLVGDCLVVHATAR